jgi:hypothetical protein
MAVGAARPFSPVWHGAPTKCLHRESVQGLAAGPISDDTTWRVESAAGVLNSLSLIPAKENSSERTHS